jgi:hypothetical protein
VLPNVFYKIDDTVVKMINDKTETIMLHFLAKERIE